MALLEAQAAGLPVVAGAVGGVPSIVADGITGLLTPPGEAGAFAAAARALLDAPARRPPWARPPRDNVRRHHDIATAAAILDQALVAACAEAWPTGPEGLTMALLALLRHGPTSWTAARRLQGRTDLPLSPEGRAGRRPLAPGAGGRRLRLADQPAAAGAGDRRSAGPWRGPGRAAADRDELRGMGRPPLARSPGRAGAGDGRDRGPGPRFPRPRRREPARGPGPASGRCWPSSAATAATGWRSPTRR